MAKEYNVVVVGVGAVGEEMLKILAGREFPIRELRVLARSPRNIQVGGRNYSVRTAAPEEFEGADLAFFAGTEGAKGASVTFAPEAIKRGAVAIDNGADFRMDPKIPLVIPEVNPEALRGHPGLIASPNCSTIQMLVALAPLYRESRIKRIIVSTYQAVSGSGRAAIRELAEQTPLGLSGHTDLECRAYPYPIAFNLLPQIGGFSDLGYTTEEWKMDRETRKIFADEEIMIAATTVRVPVFYSHSESIYIETESPLSVDTVRYILRDAPGVAVVDDPANEKYPMPLTSAHRDEVFVGRIRKDPYVENGLHLWVVSDNIRKGAALNVIQIAEKMIADGLL
jgi:aspartate-semialdehyde dehydrogenase